MAKKWMEGINGEAMDRFMADLRSGEYTQGIGKLRTCDGNMCCLGVVTYTNADSLGFKVQKQQDVWAYEFINQYGRRFATLMPKEVAEYLGIPYRYRTGTEDTSILVVADITNEGEDILSHVKVDGKHMISVVSLNDSLSFSFAQIADRIEQTFMVETED